MCRVLCRVMFVQTLAGRVRPTRSASRHMGQSWRVLGPHSLLIASDASCSMPASAAGVS